MAGDSEIAHDPTPHKASYDGFMRFAKWGTMAVAIIVAGVVFLITR